MAALAIQKETVVRRLTELRERHADPQTGKPLPQEKAAARVGVTMRQWQRWESGASLPYPRNLEAIADAFQFPVADFFDEPQPDAATSRPDGGVTARLDQMQAELEAARADRQDLRDQIAQQNANLARQSEILERIEQLVGVLRDVDIEVTEPREDAPTDERAKIPPPPDLPAPPAVGPIRRRAARAPRRSA